MYSPSANDEHLPGLRALVTFIERQYSGPTWQGIHDRMQDSVRGKVRRILAGREDSEDVCQEIWALLWKLGADYWNPRGVNLIAKQVCYKWIARDKTRKYTHFEISEKLDGDQERQAPWKEPIHEMSHLVPDVSKIAAKLMMLPDEQRAVFSFRYRLDGHEELTFREIGERLGITTSSAAHTFYQARRNLKILLGEGL